jgi:hypothetical protein
MVMRASTRKVGSRGRSRSSDEARREGGSLRRIQLATGQRDHFLDLPRHGDGSLVVSLAICPCQVEVEEQRAERWSWVTGWIHVESGDAGRSRGFGDPTWLGPVILCHPSVSGRGASS